MRVAAATVTFRSINYTNYQFKSVSASLSLDFLSLIDYSLLGSVTSSLRFMSGIQS